MYFVFFLFSLFFQPDNKPDNKATWEKMGKMNTETFSRQMQILNSSLECVAVPAKSIINGTFQREI